MPDFEIDYTNLSGDNLDQDWQLSDGTSFTLETNQVTSQAVSLGGDFSVQISVTTEDPIQVAAAELRYDYASDRWSLDTRTPNEFGLTIYNSTVIIRSML